MDCQIRAFGFHPYAKPININIIIKIAVKAKIGPPSCPVDVLDPAGILNIAWSRACAGKPHTIAPAIKTKKLVKQPFPNGLAQKPPIDDFFSFMVMGTACFPPVAEELRRDRISCVDGCLQVTNLIDQ